VVDGIPQQVHQRIADLLENLAIDLGIRSVDDQLDLFASRPDEIAQGPLEQRGHRGNRQ
jgi:hypothetical protein